MYVYKKILSPMLRDLKNKKRLKILNKFFKILDPFVPTISQL